MRSTRRSSSRLMHVTFASTYPPRACGLATFTRDLRDGLLSAGGDVSADVVAVVHERGPQRPEVAYQLLQHDRADYAACADFLNGSGTDVVCLQHEFGIFDGPEGTHVLDLMDGLRRPVVTTLHTVLPTPPAPYKRAMEAVAQRSARLVVMTETARRLLRDVYGVDEWKVAVVPHGVPDLDPTREPGLRARLGLEGRTTLLTFGLLGPGKGVEFALEAVAEVVRAVPDVLYVVVGATHPEVKRREGEAYREELVAKAEALGLDDHVRFVDRFVDLPMLWDYLRACDVYVSPYPGMDQICSGTLAYALGAGKPVVATPYLHAREALADGRGRLAPYGDVASFAAALTGLASDPGSRAEIGRAALAYGREATWSRVGAAYRSIFDEVVAETAAPRQAPREQALGLHPAEFEAARDYLRALTDNVGIFQHAAYGVPDRAHGYCTDDAARALAVVLRAERLAPSPYTMDLARTYLSFLHHAQQEDGRFHNFVSYDRRFLDETGSEDTVGRALWGLGAAVAWGPTEPMRVLARQMVERAMGVELEHPRALAYAATGLYRTLERHPGATAVRDRLHAVALKLAGHYADTDGWQWFGTEMTYANAKLPQAMLFAGDALGDDRFLRIGLDALDFLLTDHFAEGHFDPVGNQGWYPRGGERALFDQQPIEAGYMADACATAYALTGEARYAEHAVAAAEWFYGRNRLGVCLFDVQTGACYDGLSPRGANLNQGAESVLACLLGLLAVEELRAARAPVSAPAVMAP